MRPALLRRIAIVIVVAAVATALGFYAAERWRAPPPLGNPTVAEAPLVQPEFRPEFALADLDGKQRSVTEWDGKALIVNFWATWCPPCRREIPLLNHLQDEHGAEGLQVVGIALDTPEAVRAYVDDTPLDYPTLVGEQTGVDVGHKFGLELYGLPISVVTDRTGRILAVHTGELDAQTAAKLVAEALAAPAGAGQSKAR